jgi:hypothetical protein
VVQPLQVQLPDPLVYASEGAYVIVWNFNDGNGNIDVNQNVIY